MKNYVKKLALIVLVAAMATSSALSGCDGKVPPKGNESTTNTPSTTAGTESNLTAPGEFPIVKEMVKLKIVASDEPSVGPLGEVDFSKWYKEKTNVDVEYVEIMPETFKDKANLMLTTGDLPDAFLMRPFTTTEIATYGADGVFLNLKEYIEKSGVHLKKAMAEYDGVEGMMTAPDGNIYSLPNFNDCLHCQYKQKLWINKEWLKNVNMEMPTTTEEFEAVLQAFKDKDPNGNGKADEIPAMGATDSGSNYDISMFLMNSFIYCDDINDTPYLYLDNGKVTFSADKEEYREGLKYISSLVSKGLIDPTSYTQPPEQYQKVAQDPEAVRIGFIKTFHLGGVVGGYGATDDNRVTQYVGIAPFKGPSGFSVEPSNTYSERFSTTSFIITSSCKNPEVAFRWADGWYTDEATMMAWYGKEGVGWEKPAEGALGLNGEPALFKSILIPDEPGDQLRRMQNVLGNNAARFREGETIDFNDPASVYSVENILHTATKDVFKPAAKPEMNVPPLTLLPEEASEVTNIYTQVKDYCKENLALFSLGTKSAEKDWDAYVAEYKKLGIDRLLEVFQIAYDRQYK